MGTFADACGIAPLIKGVRTGVLSSRSTKVACGLTSYGDRVLDNVHAQRSFVQPWQCVRKYFNF